MTWNLELTPNFKILSECRCPLKKKKKKANMYSGVNWVWSGHLGGTCHPKSQIPGTWYIVLALQYKKDVVHLLLNRN